MEWRPIEGAPKDGKTIDLHGRRRGSMLGCDSRITDCKWGYVESESKIMMEKHWIDGRGIKIHATHWMPLPEPPK